MNAMLHSVTLLIIVADVCLVVYSAKINDFNVVFDTKTAQTLESYTICLKYKICKMKYKTQLQSVWIVWHNFVL